MKYNSGSESFEIKCNLCLPTHGGVPSNENITSCEVHEIPNCVKAFANGSEFFCSECSNSNVNVVVNTC